jgi:uncharacterized YccA/Bax inhibitor family protein
MGTPAMTVGGVVGKAFLLLALVVVGAGVGLCFPSHALEALELLPMTGAGRSTVGGPVGGFPIWPGTLAIVLTVIFMFAGYVDRAQPYLGPVFAFFQGMATTAAVGCLHSQIAAICLAVAFLVTCAVLGVLLVLYQFGWLPEISSWSAAVRVFFISIIAIYAGIFLIRMGGFEVSYPTQMRVVWWAVLCAYMTYLSYHLINCIQYIDEAIEMGVVKRMEWVAAFGLMVALLTMFFELIRIFARRRGSDQEDDEPAITENVG